MPRYFFLFQISLVLLLFANNGYSQSPASFCSRIQERIGAPATKALWRDLQGRQSVAPLRSATTADGTKAYFSTADLLATGMGIEGSTYLITRNDELRFITLSLERQSIILLTSNTDELTPARLEKLQAAALWRQLQISVLWQGKATPDAMALLELTAVTGGRFFVLSDLTTGCR